MLMQICNYIQSQGVVSQQQLMREFAIASEALQPILDFWLKKGRLMRYQPDMTCGKRCFSCKPDQVSYYRYCC